jgi:hypothetical protein
MAGDEVGEALGDDAQAVQAPGTEDVPAEPGAGFQGETVNGIRPEAQQ